MSAELRALPSAQRLLLETRLRIQPPIVAQRYWRRCLDDDERTRLEFRFGSFEGTYRALGTCGFHRDVHGCLSDVEAICGAALALNLLTRADHDWLLDEFGTVFPNLERFEQRIGDFEGLALLADPRRSFWQGLLFDCDWNGNNLVWDFLWRIAGAARRSQAVDEREFPNASGRAVTTRKSRLLNHPAFPQDLRIHFSAGRDGVHHMTLSPQSILLFRVDRSGRVVPDDGH